MASSAAHPDISARSIHHRASERTSRGCCATRMAHSTTRPETVLQMELNEVNTYFRFWNRWPAGTAVETRSLREPASRAPTRRTTSTGWKPSRSSRNIIRHSPIRRAASGLDTRFEIPYSGFISGISTAAGAVRTLRRERLRGSHRTGIARLRQRNVRVALSPGGTGALRRLPAHTGAKPVVVQEPGGRCRRTN